MQELRKRLKILIQEVRINILDFLRLLHRTEHILKKPRTLLLTALKILPLSSWKTHTM